MASFLREFLAEDAKRLSPDTGRAALLAAFGKHPAWTDHDVAIGLNTPSLLMASQRLYEQGIGSRDGPIISGAWDKLAPEELLPGFGHIFVWWRSGQFLLGRMWASSDSAHPPRDRYPLIVCLHVAGVPLAWALRNLLPRLDEVPVFCRLQSAEEIDATVKQVWHSETYRDELRTQVRLGFEGLQQQLRVLAADAPRVPARPSLTLDERREFVASPELGPDREGLLRILHQADSRFAAYLGQKSLVKADAGTLQPSQIRVPVAAPSPAEGMLRWIEFFNLVLAPDTPILLTAPRRMEWIDMTVGEPTGDQFFCLRASLQAVPVTSNIPFTLDASLRQKGSRLIDVFLSGRPTAQATALKDPGTTFFERVAAKAIPPAKENPPAMPHAKKTLWVICGLVVLAVVVVVLVVPDRDQAKFDQALAAARAAEVVNDFTNALAYYHQAQKWKADDTEVTAKIRELTPKAEEQLRLAQAGKQQEQQLAEEFRRAVASARAAEQAGNFTNALGWYRQAQKWKAGDARVAAKIQELTLKTQEQERLAETRKQQEQQAAEQFQKALALAQAAEQTGNFTNALAWYQQAQKWKADDPPVAAKIGELTLKAQEQVRLAEARKQQEQKAVEEFQKAVASAQTAEQAGNFTNALALYRQAQKWKTADALVGAKIAELTTKAEEQARLAEARTKEQLAAAALEAKFNATIADARTAEQAKDLRSALARYDEALKLKPGEPECVHKTQFLRQTLAAAEALDSALLAARQAEQRNDNAAALEAYHKALKLSPGHTEAMAAVSRITNATAAVPVKSIEPPKIEQLDTELEVYLVRFEVLKPKDPRIRTPAARKEKSVGFVSTPDRERYARRVEWLEGEYRKGGWLKQDDRAKYLDELKEAIRWR